MTITEVTPYVIDNYYIMNADHSLCIQIKGENLDMLDQLYLNGI